MLYGTFVNELPTAQLPVGPAGGWDDAMSCPELAA